jgi:hypothetical protein
MGMIRVGLIEMCEIIKNLKAEHPLIVDDRPYILQLGHLMYLWVYKNSGNIYLLEKDDREVITKEKALEILQPYLRKYKLKKIKHETTTDI